MTTNYLSEHFSYEEAISSETANRMGLSNIPDTATLLVMQRAAVKLEKVRELLKTPIHINSWYRCLVLNTLINSKSTSQHVKGEAIDFIAPYFGDPVKICKVIVANKDIIQYDQLILEHTWVHISFSIIERTPRYEVISLLNSGGYSSGLTDKTGKLL